MSAVHYEDISHLPLFNGIDSSDCMLLFDCLGCRIRCFKKDEHIRLDRDLKSTIGSVLEGGVRAYMEDIWGNRTLVSYMIKGDIFGENIAIKKNEKEKQSLAFLSAAPTRILFVPLTRILHPCKNACRFHHRLSYNMYSLMSEKNLSLMEKIYVTSRSSVREKILTYLSLESRRNGDTTFRIPLSRTEMAEYLCINRSAMSRELTALKKEGFIDYNKNLFAIRVTKNDSHPGEEEHV